MSFIDPNYNMEKAYKEGYNKAREDLMELQNNALEMMNQVNYRYIVVTQEEKDRIIESGKLIKE